jgi:hypothetical protein
MATYTQFVQAAGALPRTFGGIGIQTSNVVDIQGMTTSDVIDLFTIPANSKVLSCLIKVVEDAGETCTIDIGVTGGDTDGLVDGADLNQAAGTLIAGAGDDMPLAVENSADQKVSALLATGSTFAAGKFQFTIVYASTNVS